MGKVRGNCGSNTIMPLVIGIISIVVAGIIMFSSLISLIYIAATIDRSAVYKTFPSWYSSFEVAAFLVSFFMAAFLLTGGVRLVKRLKDSATVLKAYSVINLFFACACPLYLFFRDAEENSSRIQDTLYYQTWMIGLLLSLALSVLLLFWLGEKKTRCDMLEWK